MVSPDVINAYSSAAVGLIQVGEMAVEGIEAGVKAIAGLFGRTLSDDELAAILVSVKADATVQAKLEAIDAGGVAPIIPDDMA